MSVVASASTVPWASVRDAESSAFRPSTASRRARATRGLLVIRPRRTRRHPLVCCGARGLEGFECCGYSLHRQEEMERVDR